MTNKEKIIVSAYTGVLMCDFDEMHRYIEEKLKRPVWTHELGNEKVIEKIRDAIRNDFLSICDDTFKEE